MLPDKAEIPNMKFPYWIQNRYADIVKGNTRIFGNYNSTKECFIKNLCCLSVVFTLYDSNRHENLGKAVPPIITNGVSPKFQRATFQSVITDPPIISLKVEADFNKRAPWVLLGAPIVAYKNRLL